MEYTIKPLNAELMNHFIDFFDSLSFDHVPEWASCFCRFYYTNYSQEEWQNRTGEQNRKEA